MTDSILSLPLLLGAMLLGETEWLDTMCSFHEVCEFNVRHIRRTAQCDYQEVGQPTERGCRGYPDTEAVSCILTRRCWLPSRLYVPTIRRGLR